MFGATGSAVVALASDAPGAVVTVTYRWNADEGVLHKFVAIRNRSGETWNRLLNIRLGTYRTDAQDCPDPDYPIYVTEGHLGGKLLPVEDPAGRVRGFPAYLEGQFFASLTHPAGFATTKNGELSLRQLPGVRLSDGAEFNCMEAIYGACDKDAARRDFCEYLLKRMRRVVRQHDKPLAIFEPFGAKPDGDFWETEEFVLDNLAKVAAADRDCGLHWDYYSIDFWHDSQTDLKTPHAGRFPRGFAPLLDVLRSVGTQPGLWLDSGALGEWTIALNPAVAAAKTGQGNQLCRATAPVNQFYIDGYTHHLQNNGVRLVKFDNALFECTNPAHEHLPGEYSTEAIENALIDFYQQLDRVCPDLFIMLYWNYQSPWWLLYGDTLFDVGTRIEAASFAAYPTFRARESVTRRLDQARWMVKDLPALGWDPLGIWLSDWPWNSRVGKEAWQEGLIMDMARGHLLAQIWSDTQYLSPEERQQLAVFIGLLKQQPACFRNPRFILGNPWKEEPYGYCCTDGKRAFIALHNGVRADSLITLELNSKWGLPDQQPWDLYRWYPEPAKLRNEQPTSGSRVGLALRPMQVVLIEAVPTGELPSRGQTFAELPIVADFAEPTRPLELQVSDAALQQERQTTWTVLDAVQFRSELGATLSKLEDGSLLASGDNPSPDTYVVEASSDLSPITALRIEALSDERLPSAGPGRAVNGNFTLTELSIAAAPGDRRDALEQVRVARSEASFNQTNVGGWPVSAVTDGNLQTGWGIDPQEGLSHEAVFELARPLEFPSGTHLEFRLAQYERGHNLGRFRLSATSEKPPIPVQKTGVHFVLCGEAPSTQAGGVLAVSVQLSCDGQPQGLHECRSVLVAVGKVDGRPVTLEPVLNTAWYPASWQTWKVDLDPSPKSQAFEIELNSLLPRGIEHHFTAYFVPSRASGAP